MLRKGKKEEVGEDTKDRTGFFGGDVSSWSPGQ